MEQKFTEWLSAKMDFHEWNKSQLADLVGVTPPTIKAWLEGETPRPDKLLKLAELTGEDVYFLLNWVYGIPLPSESTSDDLRPKERTILNELHSVNERGLDLLIDQIMYVLRPRFTREKPSNGRENRKNTSPDSTPETSRGG